MFRQSGWIFTIVTATLLMLTACNPGDGYNTAPQANAASLTDTAPDEPVGTLDVVEGDYIDESGEATPWGADETQAQQTQDTPDTPTPEPTDPPPSPANASDAEALWAALQEANYQENWSTLPRKGTLYPGQAPHGALISTYLNEEAVLAVENKPGQMPDEAIILKENYTPDETLNSVTVMQKRPDFNPDHGDWFWAKYGPDGSVQAAGQVASCISCHGAVRSNDYTFSFPIAPIEVASNASSQETGDQTSNSTPTPEATTMALSEEELIETGEAHFSANCAACHQADGQGIEGTYPALDGNEFVTQDDEVAPLIDLVLTGRGAMPSFQDEFSDQDVAAVLTYVRNAWSNDAPVVSPDTVEEVRAEVGSEREPADTDQ